jgi:hypothetical protein
VRLQNTHTAPAYMGVSRAHAVAATLLLLQLASTCTATAAAQDSHEPNPLGRDGAVALSLSQHGRRRMLTSSAALPQVRKLGCGRYVSSLGSPAIVMTSVL